MRKRLKKKLHKKRMRGRILPRRLLNDAMVDELREAWLKQYKSPLEFLRTVPIPLQPYQKLFFVELEKKKVDCQQCIHFRSEGASMDYPYPTAWCGEGKGDIRPDEMLVDCELFDDGKKSS